MGFELAPEDESYSRFTNEPDKDGIFKRAFLRPSYLAYVAQIGEEEDDVYLYVDGAGKAANNFVLLLAWWYIM